MSLRTFARMVLVGQEKERRNDGEDHEFHKLFLLHLESEHRSNKLQDIATDKWIGNLSHVDVQLFLSLDLLSQSKYLDQSAADSLLFN